MNFQQFVNTLNETINRSLNAETVSQIHIALKNNGAERTGLTFLQQGTNVSPTIYLEEYYHKYQDGWTLDEISENILQLYEEVRFQHPWDVSALQDFEKIRSRIACKLIHFEKNRSLLSKTPHLPYLDLAIVFFVLLENAENGVATILITDSIRKYWGVSLEQLYQTAIKNMPKLMPADFSPMSVVICELLNKPVTAEAEEDCEMYVLTNRFRHFGAACILYNRVLEDISNQLNENFYILPSSIHEVIILPESCSLKGHELDEMITEINETQLSAEEILSDHAYYYRRKDRRLLVQEP